MGTIDFKLFRDLSTLPTDLASYDIFVNLLYKYIPKMNNRYNNMIAYTLLFFGLTNISITMIILKVKKYSLLILLYKLPFNF